MIRWINFLSFKIHKRLSKAKLSFNSFRFHTLNCDQCWQCDIFGKFVSNSALKMQNWTYSIAIWCNGNKYPSLEHSDTCEMKICSADAGIAFVYSIWNRPMIQVYKLFYDSFTTSTFTSLNQLYSLRVRMWHLSVD